MPRFSLAREATARGPNGRWRMRVELHAVVNGEGPLRGAEVHLELALYAGASDRAPGGGAERLRPVWAAVYFAHVSVTSRTKAIVWARSGNECALCHRALVERGEGDVVLGDIAHLVAQSADGPRGGLKPPGGDIDGAANLLVLCPGDHRRIDAEPGAWPLDRLAAVKCDHEAAVEARRGGQPPADRLELLDRLVARSRARSVDRWQALGVTAQVAGELADDPAVGDEQIREVLARSGPVVVLVGDVGAGKSLVGERAHLVAIAAARENPDAPAPVWLRAQDVSGNLESVVRAAAGALGVDIDRRGVQLVLDGLDEPGPAVAGALLRATRQLVLALPTSRAVLTTRQLPGLGAQDEQAHLRTLTDEQARTLVGRVAGRGTVWLNRWPRPVVEAARRPGFAVALGTVLRDDDQFRPASPAEVVDRVVQRALGEDPGSDARRLLESLAVASLKAGGAPVRPAGLVRRRELPALLATRLVVEDRGQLRFPLILIAQWFAAVTLAEESAAPAELLDEPGDLELWRYPLAIAVTIAANARVDELLEWLVSRAPALASLVLADSAAQFSRIADPLTDWRVAAQAVSAAAGNWARGLGPLARYVAPVDADGDVCRAAVRVDGQRLTVGWYEAATGGPAVSEMTEDQERRLWHGGSDLASAHSSAPDGAPGWAWRWMHHEIAQRLAALLNKRAIPRSGSPLEAEAVWQSALVALGEGNLHAGPIDVSALLAPDAVLRVGTIYDFVTVPVPHSLREGLGRHATHDGLLHCPTPGPDRSDRGSFVWSDFSPTRVGERAHAVYETALAGYEHLASGIFERLAPRMPLAVMLPARLRLDVEMHDSLSGEHGPRFQYVTEPASSGPSHVVSRLNTSRGYDERQFEAVDRSIAELRPQAARWLSSSWHTTVDVGLFGAAPATEQAFKWLWRDMETLGWVKGQLKEPQVSRLACLCDDWIDERVLRDSSFGY